jgi:hypothetical protein
MWRMLSRAPRLLVVLALACSIGLHWAFLQSVAWVTMVVSYSQNATLKEAVEKTFDGQHPCALCKQVADGKKSEKKTPIQIEIKKLTFLDCSESLAFVHHNFEMLPPVDASASSLIDPPLLPPPRSA